MSQRIKTGNAPEVTSGLTKVKAGASWQRSPLKWAGSKARLLDRLEVALPHGARLIEPFLGSATVFLNTDYPRYLLNDNNPDLVAFYRHLRDDPEALIKRIQKLFVPENNEKSAYLGLREAFNARRPRDRTHLFYYLNRHGYNGLYRVNKKGIFNVPHGRYKTVAVQEKRLRVLAEKLSAAELEHGDFGAVMQRATRGDVVYCDPAYVPLSTTAMFVSYTRASFGMADQERLASEAREAAARGATVIISNHDVPTTRELYEGATIESFDVRRSISRDTQNRGFAKELLAIFEPQT